MPYNPCGAIVDWGRHRYDTDCRFFADSDVTVPIRWYPALPDAQVLAGPHSIYQTIWDREDYTQPIVDGLGEVYDAPHKTSHMLPIPGADGSHVCGTPSDFADGAIYDPDANYPYRSDGLPVCCPGVVPKGVLWGGKALPIPGKGVLWGGKGNERFGPFLWDNPDLATTAGQNFTADATLWYVHGGLGPFTEGWLQWRPTTATFPYSFRLGFECAIDGTVTVKLGRRLSIGIFDFHDIYTGPSHDAWEQVFTNTLNNLYQVWIQVVTAGDPVWSVLSWCDYEP